MRIVEFSSCRFSQDEVRDLRSALHRHVSWFVVTALGCQLRVSERGLHQTHLRGLPRSRCQALDGGKGSSGSGRFEEAVCVGGEVAVQVRLAGLIEDAQIHRSGMEVNAAVESVLLVVLVESHRGLLAMGVGVLSPHRGWKVRPS